MKKIFLVLLTTLYSALTFAQDNSDKGYIAFSLGPSIPNGDYASTDVNNEKAGSAKLGLLLDLSFAYRLGKHFGVAAMLHSQANPVDVETLEETARLSYPGISWNINADPWSLAGLMVGGIGSWPLKSGNTTVETRVLLGFMSATLPQISITGSANGISLTQFSESKTGSGMALDFGGGFRFHVGKKISLLATLDILTSSVEFKNVKTNYPDGTYDSQTFTQNFATVNLGFGIGYRLGTIK